MSDRSTEPTADIVTGSTARSGRRGKSTRTGNTQYFRSRWFVSTWNGKDEIKNIIPMEIINFWIIHIIIDKKEMKIKLSIKLQIYKMYISLARHTNLSICISIRYQVKWNSCLVRWSTVWTQNPFMVPRVPVYLAISGKQVISEWIP